MPPANTPVEVTPSTIGLVSTTNLKAEALQRLTLFLDMVNPFHKGSYTTTYATATTFAITNTQKQRTPADDA